MISTTYTVDLHSGLSLRVLGNRYQLDPPRSSGYTLVLLHATGLHKETFEPLIEALFEASSTNGRSNVIREAWAIGKRGSYNLFAPSFDMPMLSECPNHGESAVVNDETLQRDYADACESGQSPHTRPRCSSPPDIRGRIPLCTLRPCIPDVQTRWREFAGAQAHRLWPFVWWQCSVRGRAPPVVRSSFEHTYSILLPSMTPHIDPAAIILMDGTIGRASKERDYMDVVLTQIVWSKPDVWRSREDALKWLSATPGYKSWDPRVLQAFVVRA